MIKEIADEWVNALRSGDYQRGKGGFLKDNEEGDTVFSTLGVLCDISDIGEWDGNYYLESSHVLPEEVVKWAGMKTNDGEFSWRHGSLFKLQTEEGFSYLADVIEGYWENL